MKHLAFVLRHDATCNKECKRSSNTLNQPNNDLSLIICNFHCHVKIIGDKASKKHQKEKEKWM